VYDGMLNGMEHAFRVAAGGQLAVNDFEALDKLLRPTNVEV
jgi:hypothetical protein